MSATKDKQTNDTPKLNKKKDILFWMAVGTMALIIFTIALTASGIVGINIGNEDGLETIPLEAQTEISFYEFYPVGDDMWGAPYEPRETVTSIKWFNETFGHTFTGFINEINYVDDTVTVRVTNYDMMVGKGGGGAIHSIEYIKLQREKVAVYSDDPDYIRFEWVAVLDGQITRDHQIVADFINTTLCIDYRVNRFWVKPLNNTTE